MKHVPMYTRKGDLQSLPGAAARWYLHDAVQRLVVALDELQAGAVRHGHGLQRCRGCVPGKEEVGDGYADDDSHGRRHHHADERLDGAVEMTAMPAQVCSPYDMRQLEAASFTSDITSRDPP